MSDVDQPVRMDQEQLSRLRQAAFRATKLYPGGPGELLSRELLDWVDFGYRLGASGLIYRTVDTLLGTKLPDE